MTVSTPVIPKGRKVDQVLQGARAVFLRDGFEGASVDDIAKAARVSKATLYSYFPDKRVMFLEVARAECRRHAERSAEMIEDAASTEEALRSAGENMVGFLASEFGLSMYRICVAECDRFPELGQQFYDCGPKLVRERIVALMYEGIRRGELSIDDVELAADQFAELCKVDIFPRVLFCGACRPGADEIARVTGGAVAMFMACYGTRQAAESLRTTR